MGIFVHLFANSFIYLVINCILSERVSLFFRLWILRAIAGYFGNACWCLRATEVRTVESESVIFPIPKIFQTKIPLFSLQRSSREFSGQVFAVLSGIINS